MKIFIPSNSWFIPYCFLAHTSKSDAGLLWPDGHDLCASLGWNRVKMNEKKSLGFSQQELKVFTQRYCKWINDWTQETPLRKTSGQTLHFGDIRRPHTPWTGLVLPVYCICLLCVCLFDFSFTPIEIWIKVIHSDVFVGSLDNLHFDGVCFCYRAAFMSYQCKMFLCFIVI